MWPTAIITKDMVPLSLFGLGPWATILLITTAWYISLCSMLRFRGINKLRRRFPDRESFSRMTNQDAYEILRQSSLYEFPTFFETSIHLGGLKAYCMDNIGKLLYNSSDFAKPAQATKRLEDSQILFNCFFRYPPGSKPLAESVARINYLHNPYIKAGKIHNPDLLYILAGSLNAPLRFIPLCEWRPLDDVEIAALGTLWKYIGEMLEIDYLPEFGKDQWRDGIEFVEDVKKWTEGYEREHMIPSSEIGKLGDALMDLLLSAYPKFAAPLIRTFFLVLIGERVRHALRFPEPGAGGSLLVYSILVMRKLCLRYLALPRMQPFLNLSDPDPITGRIDHHNFVKEPWYTSVTVWSQWSPTALLRRALGLMNPGDGGPELKPEGFLFVDLGPTRTVGKGVEETSRLAEVANGKVSAQRCPFSVSI